MVSIEPEKSEEQTYSCLADAFKEDAPASSNEVLFDQDEVEQVSYDHNSYSQMLSEIDNEETVTHEKTVDERLEELEMDEKVKEYLELMALKQSMTQSEESDVMKK